MARLGWAEEVFYRRLMSVVDDFGRYWADCGLLRAACYPRQLNKVSDSDIGKWLTALVEAALVRVYPAEDGERYLELLDFRQQVRAKESKFPSTASACAADATQVLRKREASAPVFVDGDVCVDGGGGEKARKRATHPPPAAVPMPDDVEPQVWTDWLALRKAKRAPVSATVLEGARSEAQKAGMSLEAFLRVWCRRGSQGLEAEWLKPGERNVSAKADAVARWMGKTAGGEVIDMEGANARIAVR